MIYDEYAAALNDVRTRHGSHSIVLIEVGSFFEMYAVTDAEATAARTGLSESEMRRVCDLMEIQMTKKNKSTPEVGKSNPFMAGFPSFMLDKYVDALVSEGYTVAIMEQKKTRVKGAREKTKETLYRTVTRIESPGTHMPSTGTSGGAAVGRFTMALCIYTCKGKNPQMASFGTAVADFTTGEMYVYQPHEYLDPRMVREDLYRVVLSFKPVELIVMGSDDSCDVDNVLHFLDLDYVANIHKIDNASITKTYKKASYQNAILAKVWPVHCTGTMLSPLEVFDMEMKPCAASALCALLQFAHDHGEHVIRQLRPPRTTHGTVTDACMSLNYNSVVQLDIMPNRTEDDKGKRSFLGIFNKCVTAMGKRLFQRRLMCPIHDCAIIQARHDAVQRAMSSSDTANFEVIRKEFLDGIPDMPRLLRKLVSGRIDHAGLWQLYLAVHRGSACLARLDEQQLEPCAPWTMSFLRYIEDTVTEPTSQDYACHQVWFKCLASHVKDITDKTQLLENIIKHLNLKLERYKLDFTDRDGYFIAVTSKRHKDALVDSPRSDLLPGPGDLVPLHLADHTKSAANIRLTHPLIKETNAAIETSKAAIQERTKDVLAKVCDMIITEYHDRILDLSDKVAEVDVNVTNAKLAHENGWTRPIIASNKHEKDPEPGTRKPFVDAKEIRHPIVEHLLSTHAYVPNDVMLGKDGTDGMLLFGINASGKSSLMKSIGLAVIMAQAGMFVAAREFTFRPYKAVFTRIAAGDNIFAGKSTFTNEILELRNILKAASSDSLVIGDELCAGTESSSAVAIVAAGIERLSNARCTFLLATHLHEITRMNLIDHVHNLSVYHLDVRYNQEDESIVYDRTLVPGPGEALYGLEVCKALDMDADFIMSASKIRNRLLNVGQELVSTKESRYNARVFMDVCQVCKSSMSVETHHLVPQSIADNASGLVLGRYHKNKDFNLLCVCSDCHDRLHAPDSNKDLNVFAMSTRGPVLLNMAV